MATSVFDRAVIELNLKTNEDITDDTFLVCGKNHRLQPGITEKVLDGGFLRDVQPSLRRTALATHQIYIQQAKYAEFWKGYEHEENAQNDVITAVTTFPIITSATSNEEQPSRKRSRSPPVPNQTLNLKASDSSQPAIILFPDSTKNQPTVVAIPCEDSVDNCTTSATDSLNTEATASSEVPRRTSHLTLYHKFISHLQMFYNEHDSLGLLALLLYPCCMTEIQRGSVIWSSCFEKYNPRAVTRTLPSNFTIIAQSNNSLSISDMGKSYETIFTRYPDAIILYHLHLLHIKQNPLTNETIIYTPFTYFVTIPNVTIKIGGIDRQYAFVRVELKCCTKIKYDGENGLITTADDHFYRVHVDHPHVQPKDVLKYLSACFTK